MSRTHGRRVDRRRDQSYDSTPRRNGRGSDGRCFVAENWFEELKRLVPN